jgi:hypothetical protein
VTWLILFTRVAGLKRDKFSGARTCLYSIVHNSENRRIYTTNRKGLEPQNNSAEFCCRRQTAKSDRRSTTPLAAELLSTLLTLLTHAVRVRRALQLSGNLGLNRILLRGASVYREVGE